MPLLKGIPWQFVCGMLTTRDNRTRKIFDPAAIEHKTGSNRGVGTQIAFACAAMEHGGLIDARLVDLSEWSAAVRWGFLACRARVIGSTPPPVPYKPPYSHKAFGYGTYHKRPKKGFEGLRSALGRHSGWLVCGHLLSAVCLAVQMFQAATNVRPVITVSLLPQAVRVWYVP